MISPTRNFVLLEYSVQGFWSSDTPNLPLPIGVSGHLLQLLANSRSTEAPAAADIHLHVSQHLCAQPADGPARSHIRVSAVAQ